MKILHVLYQHYRKLAAFVILIDAFSRPELHARSRADAASENTAFIMVISLRSLSDNVVRALSPHLLKWQRNCCRMTAFGLTGGFDLGMY